MNPYIKFLHQIREISKLDEFPRMTPLSKLIFDQVALYEAMGNPLTALGFLDTIKQHKECEVLLCHEN